MLRVALRMAPTARTASVTGAASTSAALSAGMTFAISSQVQGDATLAKDSAGAAVTGSDSDASG